MSSASRYLRTPGGGRRRSPVAAVVILALCSLSPAARGSAGVPPEPIPNDPQASEIDPHEGHPAKRRSLASFAVPRHPFMAPNGRSNIHNDAYMTDAYRSGGPLGRSMRVRSTLQAAECASVTFDRAGRIVTICVGLEGPRLLLINPRTLATKAEFPLPARSPSPDPFTDFSGGGYFYLDHRYRAVVPTTNGQIWVVRERRAQTGPEFELARAFPLQPDVAPTDDIVSALPDWNGLVWFVTAEGVVGTLDRRTAAVNSVALAGERITNSFATDEHGGVYIVTDHKLYRFAARADGSPRIMWSVRYDRGRREKPGQVGQGSGTTPTLVGRRYVAITDNADPRMHVVVYRRGSHAEGRRKLCQEPVFGRRRGATDNSLVAVGRTLIVENNYGYSGPTSTMNGQSTVPGVARVKFGTNGCRTLWTSRHRSPSVVPKVSLSNGLLYLYTKPPRKDELDPWYFTAVRLRTGRTVYKTLAGVGFGYNNNYAPVSIGPDGSAYVGVLGGLVRLRDRR